MWLFDGYENIELYLEHHPAFAEQDEPKATLPMEGNSDKSDKKALEALAKIDKLIKARRAEIHAKAKEELLEAGLIAVSAPLSTLFLGVMLAWVLRGFRKADA